MAKILIIDDEEQLRKLLARIIALEGYEVAEAPDCASGMKTLRRYDPDVVLCDVKLPDGNGVEMVGRIKEAAPATEVILLTAYGNIPDGVQAIKNGAFDYITKGDDNNKILPLLSRATEDVRQRGRRHGAGRADLRLAAALRAGHARAQRRDLAEPGRDIQRLQDRLLRNITHLRKRDQHRRQHAAAARRGRGDDALHARIALGHLERLLRHALKIRPAEEAAGLRRRAESGRVAADEPAVGAVGCAVLPA